MLLFIPLILTELIVHTTGMQVQSSIAEELENASLDQIRSEFQYNRDITMMASMISHTCRSAKCVQAYSKKRSKESEYKNGYSGLDNEFAHNDFIIQFCNFLIGVGQEGKVRQGR